MVVATLNLSATETSRQVQLADRVEATISMLIPGCF